MLLVFALLALCDVVISDLISCTGTLEPKSAVPFCYNGTGSIFGGAFSETVMLKINEFASHKGYADIFVSGTVSQTCKHIAFDHIVHTQIINITMDHCIQSVTLSAKYCSDQDKILIALKISHIPENVTAQLYSSKCI